MRKIFLVTPYPNKDEIHLKGAGVAAYSFYLAKELSENIEVEVWAQKGKDLIEYIDQENKNKITVKRVWEKNIFGIWQIIKFAFKERPEIIHVQHEFNMFGGEITLPFSPLMVIVPRLLGIKVVTTFHGGIGLEQIDKTFVQENGKSLPPFIVKLAFRYIFGLFALFSNKIIVHEQFQKDELVNEHFVNKNKITVIPHGVPEKVEIVENAKSILNISEDKKVLLYMGFAAKYKGLPELFDFYKEYIKTKEGENSLLIIGAGPMLRLENDKNYMAWYEDLKNKFESLGENVRWVGFIPSDKITTYYSASDVVLFPYSRRLAASGPMAIAIGYEKNIVISSVLKGEKEFKFDFGDIIKTENLKTERVWYKVAEKTFEVSKK